MDLDRMQEDRRQERRVWTARIVSLVVLAVSVIAVVMARNQLTATTEEEVRMALEVSRNETESYPDVSGEEVQDIPEEEPYVSPVDFKGLRAMNRDIYAWLEIPGTGISYPILQHDTDNAYYLSHDSSGTENKEGALFTEYGYNSTDMEDPVTVVYGHHMKSGTMFGHLQEFYSEEDALDTYKEIIVYLPDREYHYQVFAAVPANRQHILYYYDCTDSEIYQLFLDRVFAIRSVGASFNESVAVTTEDKMLILSTCLEGNSKNRYLVLAKRVS